MNKFTQGHWQVNKKVKFFVETVNDGQGINIIADCEDKDGKRSNHEDYANARLIAAAPELLAALQNAHIRACKARLYGVDMLSSKNLCLDDVISIITEAINKAKGK